MLNERSYLASSVRAAHEALLIALAPAIDDANFDLMMNAKQEGAAALDTRLEYLRRLLETESESNLLAGLLTEASLVSDPRRLEPLRDLIDSAQRKITKNLNAISDRAQQEKLIALYKQLAMIAAEDGIIPARAYELSQQHDAQLAFTCRAGRGYQAQARCRWSRRAAGPHCARHIRLRERANPLRAIHIDRAFDRGGNRRGVGSMALCRSQRCPAPWLLSATPCGASPMET